MLEPESKLPTNIIGRLFGIDCIGIEDGKLIAVKKGVIVSSTSIGPSMDFARYKRGMFGGTLIINTPEQVKKLRFLKSIEAKDFLKGLNRKIAKNITAIISGSFEIFTTCAFKEYPRDSKNDLLSNLCRTISERWERLEFALNAKHPLLIRVFQAFAIIVLAEIL